MARPTHLPDYVYDLENEDYDRQLGLNLRSQEQLVTPESPLGGLSRVFKPIETVIDPEGHQRSVSSHLEPTEDLISAAEAYLQAFDPELLGADRPRAHLDPRNNPQLTQAQPQVHQYLGDRDDEAFIGRPGVRTPDGNVIEVPPNAAYQPSTGRYFVPRTSEFHRGTFIPVEGRPTSDGPELRGAFPGVLHEIYDIARRAHERWQFGLEIPEQQRWREAFQVAGTMSSGGTLSRGVVTREMRSAAEEAMQRAVATPERSTRAVTATEGLPQLRTRPVETRPHGHITLRAARTEREAALRANQPELDEAGFYINALERGKRELPESATANEMRQALQDMKVEPAEIRMLGLDRMLLGEVGIAREAANEAERELSRLANSMAKLRAKVEKNPDNTGYRAQLADLKPQIIDARKTLMARKQAEYRAAREHLREVVMQAHNAERYHKAVNAEIRTLRKEGQTSNTDLRSVEWPGVNLIQERIASRKAVAETRAAVEAARSRDPGLRTVTREQVLRHIRENRPRLDFFVRRYQASRYGDMSEPIRRIQTGNGFRDSLIERGIAKDTADSIAESFKQIPVADWFMRASALGNHMREFDIIVKALEDAAGAKLRDMVLAARGQHKSQAGFQNPRYASAIPDSTNQTLAEIAVILRGPWSARHESQIKIRDLRRVRDAVLNDYNNAQKGSADEARLGARYEELNAQLNDLQNAHRELPKPPFTSGHWSDDIAPIGHMQVTIQRTPNVTADTVQQRQMLTRNLASKRDKVTELDHAIDVTDDVDRASALMRQRRALERDISKLEDELNTIYSAGDDQIFMGNQFQSDWAAKVQRGGTRSAGDSRKLDELEKRLSQLNKRHLELSNTRTNLLDWTNERRDANLPRDYRSPESEAPHIALRQDISNIGKALRRIEIESMKTEEEITRLRQLPAGHPLVASTKAWLRPVLEQFVESGLRSRSRYLGIPSGRTVRTHNPTTDAVADFYDKVVMQELKYILKRRGYSTEAQKIDSMFSPDGKKSFNGEWFLFDLQRQQPSGSRGVRLMSGGIPVPIGDSNGQAATN